MVSALVSAPVSLDAVHLLGLGALAAAVYVVWGFARWPYAENLRLLPRAEVKHWFYGSWPPGAEISGEYERHLLSTVAQHGPVCTYTEMGHNPVIAIGDHKAVSTVLLQRPYNRVPIINDMVTRHVAAGLIATEGVQHKRQRKVAQPAFTQASVYKMAGTMQEKAADFVARLHRAIAKDTSAEAAKYGTPLDIAQDFSSAALDIIGVTACNYQFNSLRGDGSAPSALERAFHDCLHTLTTGTGFNLLRILFGSPVEYIGRLFRIEEQLLLDRSRALVRQISAELVEHAKKDSSVSDLLSLMVKANNSDEIKPSQRLTDEDLRELVPVMLFAGHETTATALAWAMLELIHPVYGNTIQQRLRDELLAEGEVWRSDPQALDALPYMDAFVRETLRFYCPVRNIPRQAPYDDVIPLSRPVRLRDGSMAKEIRVLKGQTVQIPVAYLNKDESIWGPTGREFRPERWLPGSHPLAVRAGVDGPDTDACVDDLKGVFAHLVTFGAGTQMCLGIRMAVLEFKVLMAALVTSFEVLPPALPGQAPVEIESIDMIVSKPVLKGQRELGMKMPVRLQVLSL